MRIKVVDGGGGELHRQSSLISYLVNDNIAIDAGALALMPLAEQKRLTTLFLSHSHVDHLATLPLLIDNLYQPGPQCIDLYASAVTIRTLKAHVFNDHLWPDLVRLSSEGSPFVAFHEIEHGQRITLGDVSVTPFDVQHTIPTLGYVVQDPRTAVAIVADTAPCDDIWSFLAPIENLRSVFLEISFPNSMQWLADISGHLTTRDFVTEIGKLQRKVDWYITHMKPEFADQIACEVERLRLDHCRFAMGGMEYEF